MKTTIELPDATFRRAKAAAALRGQSLRELITEAIEGHLSQRPAKKIAAGDVERRWKKLARDLASGGQPPNFVDELVRMRRGRDSGR